ncbi:MAG: OmpA family protein, partial [Myxococcales bacterium]|nr:OmpA family protein [Myxococcales bacterium]
NLLRATYVDNTSGVGGAAILSIDRNGELRGVRSDNGAPFRVYNGLEAADGVPVRCTSPPSSALTCGSIVYGINFDYDSADIRPESRVVLDALFQGLQGVEGAIVIEGHTSSEGSEAYNQSLSERRAQSVVDELVGRGLSASQISASGRGEDEPIAPNDTETGRSMNRRVVVTCQ